MKKFLVCYVGSLLFTSSAFAISPSANNCAAMAVVAYKIVDKQSSQTEQEAARLVSSFKFPPYYADALEGLMAIIYKGGAKLTPAETASAMYSQCVFSK